MSELSDAIKSMVEEKGMSLEKVLDTIKQTLLATYKRKFGTDENAVVTFADDYSSVELCAEKVVVDEDDFEDEVLQMPLDEALEYTEDAEVGDTLRIPIDVRSFDRISVQTGKQKAQSVIRDIQKNALLADFQGKVGQIINGYVQGEKDGDLIVDLGKTQGYLPRKNQSPKEFYQKGDKIRCYVESVRTDEKSDRQVRVLLSRAHEDFVRRLFEIYVPEIVAKDPSVGIMKIVREAGYRTKVAVYPKKVEADAVGTCVGLKGNRIQAIMKEMDDERIDVIKWDPNPLEYIANALSPAKVQRIIVTDETKKEAIAIVDESQLSLAIGKQGLNVRLVTRLCDWVVNVKTEAQFAEMDISREARAAADAVFSLDDSFEQTSETVEEEGEMMLTDLPISSSIISKLNFYDVYTVEEFINLAEDELSEFEKLSADEIETVNKIIAENVDIVEEEGADQDEQFVCPNCGHPISEGMTECPNCHAEISFEIEEDEE